MSMNRIQTFSFGVMQSLSMFTIFDSRTPRSTRGGTRERAPAPPRPPRSSDPLRAKVFLGWRRRLVRFDRGCGGRRLFQDVLEGDRVPTPERIALLLVDPFRGID